MLFNAYNMRLYMPLESLARTDPWAQKKPVFETPVEGRADVENADSQR